MDPKLQCVIILIIAIIVIYMAFYRSEGFATKQEKATAIYNWFSTTNKPNYTSYRKALNDESNIIEYDDVMNLFRKKDLTISAVKDIIG